MEDRILELEKRLEKLENKEKRRTAISAIKTIIMILIIIGLIYGGYKLYTKVEDLIKPYKEVIDIKDKKIKTIKDLFE